MIFLLLIINATGSGISVQTHNVIITRAAEEITVNETLEITGETDGYYETLSFWIPTDHSNLRVIVNSQEINTVTPQNQNLYLCNLSSLNISAGTTININIRYNLKSNITEFQKTLTYNTSMITINFNGEELYTATNLLGGTIFSVKLPEEKTTVTIEKADYSPYYYIIFFLIILIVILLYLKIRQKEGIMVKRQITQSPSEELLTTRKALLMEILKEIEKKYRVKQISEDTYHKLKEYYKQEAVETMKQLDDMKSKIK